MNGYQNMIEYMDEPATCGHRRGSLVFERDGLRCPSCAVVYRWGTPLETWDATPTTEA